MKTKTSHKDRNISFWRNIYSNIAKLYNEEDRRRKLFLILALPGGLTLLIFGIYNLLYDNTIGGFLDIIFSIALAVSCACLTYVKNPNFIFRVNLLALAIVIIIWCIDGGVHGEKLLWAFCFPPMALIMFGRKEGVIWNLSLFSVILLIFITGSHIDAHVYNIQFKIRFVCAFLLVIIVTYLYESLLYIYQENLSNKQSRLDSEKKKLAQAADSIKSANEALLKSERLLLHAQRIAHLGSWEWDVRENTSFCSEETYRLLGLPTQQPGFSLENFLGLVHPDDYKRVNQAIKDSLAGGTPYNQTYRIIRPDGAERTHHGQAEVILDEYNQPLKMVGTQHDITERKQLEDQLRKTQKMEFIGTLAGGIAHDFNNILFPIIVLSEMLLEDLAPDSVEYGNAQEILKAGKRGSDLVKQILAFSRQSEYRLIPVRIQQVLKEVLKLCRSTIPSDIEITNEIQPDCGLVEANPTQIHQVAMNLMTNAYHAVEETGGRISVALREIQVQPDLATNPLVQGQYAMLSVSDTGCGIDPKVIDKIFEPYFTTKRQGKGTGLGLAVTQGIVKEYKGKIEVYSDVGKGTTFKIYLPLMENVSETASAKKMEILKTGDEQILLVDDEETVARLEKQMLERLGYKVTSHTSSLAALRYFREKPYAFDLVITDMAMPNMTGDQLAKELMSIRVDIPVIIITGFSERINKERAKAIGIKGILMKPVVKSEMAQVIRKVID